jgi:hypothetical protein
MPPRSLQPTRRGACCRTSGVSRTYMGRAAQRGLRPLVLQAWLRTLPVHMRQLAPRSIATRARCHQVARLRSGPPPRPTRAPSGSSRLAASGSRSGTGCLARAPLAWGCCPCPANEGRASHQSCRSGMHSGLRSPRRATPPPIPPAMAWLTLRPPRLTRLPQASRLRSPPRRADLEPGCTWLQKQATALSLAARPQRLPRREPVSAALPLWSAPSAVCPLRRAYEQARPSCCCPSSTETASCQRRRHVALLPSPPLPARATQPRPPQPATLPRLRLILSPRPCRAPRLQAVRSRRFTATTRERQRLPLPRQPAATRSQ